MIADAMAAKKRVFRIDLTQIQPMLDVHRPILPQPARESVSLATSSAT